MREIQMHPPSKRKPYDVVRRLQFFAESGEVLALVGPERFTYDGRNGLTNRFFAYDLAIDSARELYAGDWFLGAGSGEDYRTPYPWIAPDCKLLVFESLADGDDGYIIFEEIVDALARGDRVELRGFGAFTVKHRPPRTGRNPRTGTSVSVEEKFVPFFKTGKELRERLNAEA